LPADSESIARATKARGRKVFAAIAAAIIALTTTAYVALMAGGNFGVVDPGTVYRSAQPTSSIEQIIRDRRLASILNLRGGTLANSWYSAEVHAARALHVDFYDFPMSATRRPTRRELLTLIDIFGRCRYPLLIHCKSGSDRTGLATALYLMIVRGVGPREALGSFTLRHAHVPLFGPERLHEPLDEYGDWLEANGLAHSPARFRRWVEESFTSDDPAVTFRPLRPGPRRMLEKEAAVAGDPGAVR
jgi:hypothetical protein